MSSFSRRAVTATHFAPGTGAGRLKVAQPRTPTYIPQARGPGGACTEIEYVFDGTVPDGDGGHSSLFNYTWTVPGGVTEITVDAYGANGEHQGGNPPSGGGLAGHGDRIIATLPVIPGETLYINVGGTPDSAGGSVHRGGFNGGGAGWTTLFTPLGGGGGASDVRRSPGGLDDRLIVAGGGGGGGGDYSQSSEDDFGHGGDGGYPDGAQGKGNNPGNGEGGTQTAGGLGNGVSPPGFGNGGFGFGGSATTAGTAVGADGGGGGGGGWYGGGRGDDGGGGGGGSSYVHPTATLLSNGAGWRDDRHGLVTISYRCDVDLPAAPDVETGWHWIGTAGVIDTGAAGAFGGLVVDTWTDQAQGTVLDGSSTGTATGFRTVAGINAVDIGGFFANLLSLSSVDLPQPFTIYVACISDGTGTSRPVFYSTGSGANGGFTGTRDAYLNLGATLTAPNQFSTVEEHLLRFVGNGVSSSVRVDRGYAYSGNAGTLGLTGTFSVGGNAGDWWDGPIGEMRIYPRLLDPTEDSLIVAEMGF